MSGRQKPSSDTTYANPSLSRIKIFEAYLKRLIGCVILMVRLSVESEYYSNLLRELRGLTL